MKKLSSLLFLAAVVAGCAKNEPAQLPAAQEPPKSEATTAKAPPQMSPAEMQKKFVEFATPAEDHAKLGQIIGKWKTETKFWMDPNKKPEVSKGKANIQWMLGKRYVKQDYVGRFQGRPFRGAGIMGFDKVKKEYFSSWIDSMGTGIMLSYGKLDQASNTFEFNGKFSCPMNGGDQEARTVLRVVSKKKFVFEMYAPTPDGKEIKAMEITYTKVG